MKLKATKIFRDKETGEIYQIGGEVSTNDIDRINDLVGRGLAVVVSVDVPETRKGQTEKTVSINGVEVALEKAREAFGKVGVKVAANSSADTLTKKLSGLTEEQLTQLYEALNETETKPEE